MEEMGRQFYYVQSLLVKRHFPLVLKKHPEECLRSNFQRVFAQWYLERPNSLQMKGSSVSFIKVMVILADEYLL
jgi:hypothetical protein